MTTFAPAAPPKPKSAAPAPKQETPAVSAAPVQDPAQKGPTDAARNTGSDDGVAELTGGDDGDEMAQITLSEEEVGTESLPEGFDASEFLDDDSDGSASTALGAGDDESSDPATETQASAESADEFNPQTFREQAAAQNAAVALLDAGLAPATVQGMLKSDPKGLVALAQKIAGAQQAPANEKTGKQKDAATDADPFASIFENATKELAEHMDEEGIPKFLAPMRQMADLFRAEIQKVRDEYEGKLGTVQNTTIQSQLDSAARSLMGDFPQLKDQAQMGKVLQKMNENGLAGKRYPSYEAMMKEAAGQVFGSGNAEIRRRQEIEKQNKDRSRGQMTAPGSRVQTAGKPKEIGRDEYDAGIFRVIEAARKSGKADGDPNGGADAAVARFKAKYVVRRA